MLDPTLLFGVYGALLSPSKIFPTWSSPTINGCAVGPMSSTWSRRTIGGMSFIGPLMRNGKPKAPELTVVHLGMLTSWHDGSDTKSLLGDREDWEDRARTVQGVEGTKRSKREFYSYCQATLFILTKASIWRGKSLSSRAVV